MQHFWPGESINLPFTEDFDTRAYDTLAWTFPDDPAHPYDTPGAYQKGFDREMPTTSQGLAQGPSGVYPSLFSVVGDGREVTFIAVAHTPDEYYQENGGDITGNTSIGIVMLLMQPGFQSPTPGLPQGWVATAATPGDGGRYDKAAAITYTLEAGHEYILAVSSYQAYRTVYEDVVDPQGVSRQLSYPAGGQQFHVDFRYAVHPANDVRSVATHVAIATDGGTYRSNFAGIVNSNLTYNANVTQYGSYPDDQPDEGITYTAWWFYQPATSGTFHALFTMQPEDDPSGHMIIYREQPDDAPLVKLNDAMTQDITCDAGAKYWIVLGIYQSNQPAAQIYHLTVTGPRSAVAPNPNPDPIPPTVPYVHPYTQGLDPIPPTAPYVPGADPYNPGAKAGPATDNGQSSLLDLIRAFSAGVMRAVRITGPSTIEMVDPAVPLPSGWSSGEGSGLYSSATRSAASELQALSARNGLVSLAAGAQLISDDVRLVRSTWRIPDRLPVLGLPPAPVKRVTYTFTPTVFQATVDFHFRDEPLEAGRQ